VTASASTRTTRLAAAAAFLLLIFAGPAGAHATSLGFSSLPRRFAQHDPVTIAVAVRPAGVVCTLSIRFADGQTQPGLNPVGAAGGHARWRFRIPEAAAPGRSTVRVACGRAGQIQRTVLVVGSVIPARIDVVKDGYTVRTNPFGGGSVSYGVILRNASPNQDALQVYALVNFVGADNKLVGSATTTVPGIPAVSQFALGGDVSFFGAPPTVARLEVVVQIGKRQAHSLKQPSIANVKIAASAFEPQWVGSVEGEVSNDDRALVLHLPPASREFFKIESGLRSIPFANAASAMVSAIGTYQQP
jgi:hypothetical protein